MKTAKELAEDHWGYVGGLLEMTDWEAGGMSFLKYVYETAFVHGFRHGVESCGVEHEEVGIE